MGNWLRHGGRHACVVAGVALALQLAYLTESDKDPTFGVPIVDAGRYHLDAAQFAAGGEFRGGASFQPPLFPLALGCLYRVVGVRVLAAKVLLALSGVAGCVLLWSIGRRIFDARVGLLAGLTLAAYGPFLFFSTQLLPTGPAILLGLIALWMLLDALERPRWFRWLVFGLLLGLATLTAPNAVVLWFVAVCSLVVSGLRSGRLRVVFSGIALASVGTALPIGLVAVHSYARSGEWVFVANNGGINFYLGNNPTSDQTLKIRPGHRWYQHYRSAFAAGARTPATQNAFFFRKTLRYVRSDPAGFLRGLWRKAGRICNAREIPRSVDLYVHRDFSHLLSILVWRKGPFAMPFGLLAPFAAMGFVVAGRMASRANRPSDLWWILPAWTALYGVSVVVFFVSARHRLPIMPVVVLLAAAGGVWAWREVFRHDRRHTSKRLRLAAVVAFVVAAGLVNRSIRVPSDATNFRAELYSSVGAALAERGDLGAGERNVRKALQIDDEYAVGHSRLGVILARRGAAAQAEACFRRALALDARASEVHWYLGNALLGQGRTTEAIEAVDRSLDIDPYAPEAHAVLGDILLATGRPDKAIRQYTLALELPPRRGDLLFSLAGALVQVGNHAAAIQRYHEGLAEVGPHPRALSDLAWLLITCPEAHLRNCEAAIELAETLCRITSGRDPVALETLGAAYAACGRMGAAEKTLARAIDLAVAVGDRALADAFRAVLARLQTNAGATGASQPPGP